MNLNSLKDIRHFRIKISHTKQLRNFFCSEKLNSWSLSFARQHSFALESKLNAYAQYFLIQCSYLKVSSESQDYKIQLQHRYLDYENGKHMLSNDLTNVTRIEVKSGLHKNTD